jgi:hypothetical protein
MIRPSIQVRRVYARIARSGERTPRILHGVGVLDILRDANGLVEEVVRSAWTVSEII